MTMTMDILDDVDDPASERTFSLESYSRGDDGVVFFREPRRLAGLAILTRDDGQWVYFPSTGRVRMLSGAARSGSVSGVGGDFSYEDLGAGSWGDDYEFTIDSIDEDAWTLEGRPASADSAYNRIVMEVPARDFIPRRIEFYEGDHELSKTLTVVQVEEFSGRLTPAVMIMESSAGTSRTTVEVRNVEFDRDLPDSLFHPGRFYR
ncbi:MAG: outer membrane lipoprotein-sorting protein [Spirochaetota bacterium]